MGEQLMTYMSKLKAKIALAQYKLTLTKKHGWKLIWGIYILGLITGLSYMFVYTQLKNTKIVYIDNAEAQVVGEVVDKSTVAHASIEESEVKNSTHGEIATSKSSHVISLINKIAKEENFTETENLKRLLFCESSLGRKKINYNQDKRKTIDRGVAMINSYWHSEVSEEDAMNDEFSIRWTINRIQAGYLHEWNCSGIYNNINYKYE